MQVRRFHRIPRRSIRGQGGLRLRLANCRIDSGDPMMAGLARGQDDDD